MNNGQKLFHDFFMSMVQEGKEEEAEAVLAAGFRKQDEGTFDAEYLQSVMDKYYALIKPEDMEKMKEVMAQFAAKL